MTIDEMVDHIDYILAKTESQSITEFRANATCDKAWSDRWNHL